MSKAVWEIMQSIFIVVGGLGLFFFGMKMMSEGFKSIAGERLRIILEKMTSNRFLGVLAGTIVTFITNSSSATTIMVVGFINSKLMNLAQAFVVIMGANIGTTLSSQLISFKLDTVAPLFIFIGAIMHLFFKKKNIKNIGYVLLGFGVLFFGITMMGGPLEQFADKPGFQSLLTAFENPVLALLAGLIFTAIIQSSSATTGILVAMYLSGIDFPFQTAAFIILGSNIGTCSDSLIAALAANRESKRAALGNIIFKVTGSVIFGSLIFIFPGILNWIQATWPDGARQVAMFHSLFNVSTAILFLPFIKQFVALMQKIIPLKPEEIDNTYEKRLIYLNSMQTPTVAVTNAHLEFCRMGSIACENLELALASFFKKDGEKAQKVLENEDIINYLNHHITSYLVTLHGEALPNKDIEKIGMMIRTITDMERIGDHAENIAEYAMIEENTSTDFSPEAMKDLQKLSETTIEIVKLALDIYEKNDRTQLPEIDILEKKADRLAKKGIENHIQRLKDTVCDPRNGVVYTDMVINLERCADHATNIAYSILGEVVWDEKQHELMPVTIKKKKKRRKK